MPKRLFSSLDPRAALSGAFIVCAVMACLQSMAACVAALFIGASALLVSGDGKKRLRQLIYANIFVGLMWVIVPFTTPGPAIMESGFLKLTMNGVRLCLLLTLKANSIMLVFLALIPSISVSGMGSALRWFGCPPKFVLLLLLMGRNIHLLTREWDSLVTAAKLRAFCPRNNLHTYKTLGAMLALLLVRAHDRADRMRQAMLLRGFDGSLNFSVSGAFTRGDMIFELVAVSAALLLLAINFFLPL